MPYGNFRGGGKGFKSFGQRESHKIKCSECGKEDTVPFKPREGTPVYCKNCFFKKKGITPRNKTEEKPAEETESEEDSEESEEELEEETEEEY
jgi:CxxC-x17-CxxC domain-containing protein